MCRAHKGDEYIDLALLTGGNVAAVSSEFAFPALTLCMRAAHVHGDHVPSTKI